VDLDEQLSAFDHYAILKQSEFVQSAIKNLLSMYPEIDHFPIMAHSMGGIVAKDALLKMGLYKSWTLITVATPHNRPPFSISRDLSLLFSNVRDEWELKMKSNTLISIVGGVLDTMISPELTKVNSAIMMYTTGMVDIWTAADHKMLLWCNQLIFKLSNFLLSEYSRLGGDQDGIAAYLDGNDLNHNTRLVPLSNALGESIKISNDVAVWAGERVNLTFAIDQENDTFQIFARHDFQLKIFGCTLETCYEVVRYESNRIPLEQDFMGRKEPRRTGRFALTSVEPFEDLMNITFGIKTRHLDPNIRIRRVQNCEQLITIGFLGNMHILNLDLLFRRSKFVHHVCSRTKVSLDGINDPLFVYRMNIQAGKFFFRLVMIRFFG
jgi:hypothetical protein